MLEHVTDLHSSAFVRRLQPLHDSILGAFDRPGQVTATPFHDISGTCFFLSTSAQDILDKVNVCRLLAPPTLPGHSWHFILERPGSRACDPDTIG